jgi:tetratricopeptide (TPR) repeat protein
MSDLRKKLPLSDGAEAKAHDARLKKALDEADKELKAGKAESGTSTYLSVIRAVVPRSDASAWIELLLEKAKSLPGDGAALALDVIAERAWEITGLFISYKHLQEAAIVGRLMAAARPDDPRWQGRAATLFYYAGMRKEMLEQADKTLARWPAQPQALIIKAYTLRAYGRYEEAIVEAKKVTEECPTSREGWTTLGLLYSILARHDESIETFNEALKYFPDDSTFTNYLGLCYRWRGDKGKELETFRRGALLHPSGKWPQHNMIWLFLHEPGVFVEETFAALKENDNV